MRCHLCQFWTALRVLGLSLNHEQTLQYAKDGASTAPCATSAALHKGRWYVDGSLQDFVLWRNSDLLTCRGSAFVVDYSMVRLQAFTLRCYQSFGRKLYIKALLPQKPCRPSRRG